MCCETDDVFLICVFFCFFLICSSLSSLGHLTFNYIIDLTALTLLYEN